MPGPDIAPSAAATPVAETPEMTAVIVPETMRAFMALATAAADTLARGAETSGETAAAAPVACTATVAAAELCTYPGIPKAIAPAIATTDVARLPATPVACAPTECGMTEGPIASATPLA